jgi:hypothetical protein
MLKRNILAAGCVLAAAVALLAGCTQRSTDGIYQSDTSGLGSGSSAYFPTAAGKVSTFAVTYDGGAQSSLTLEIGNASQYGSINSIEWLAIRPDNSIDTDYVVVGTSGVTLYETMQSQPETFLKFPLQPGQTWDRFAASNSTITTSDTATIAAGFDDGSGIVTKGGGGNGGGGGGTGKVVPGTSGNVSRVNAIEEIVLSNGSHFSATVKVEVDDQSGLQNYYWFAPGIGLVKYVVGATAQRPNGTQRGELIS